MMILPVSMKEAIQKGNPFFIELYTIHLRTSVLRLCACDEDIVFNGNKYIAVPIQREDIEKSIDSLVNDCSLQVNDCSDEMLAYILNGYDFRNSRCEIIRIQYPDSLNDPSCYGYVFTGEIDEPSFADGVFSCKVVLEFPQIQVPNRDYQMYCNSDFGDEECCMNVGREVMVVTKSANSPNVLILPKSYEKNHWLHGTITMEGETRTIIKSDKNTITLNINFLQVFTSRQAELKRGCDKSASMCKKYGNMIHFSGFPAIPFENIYR